MEAVIVSVNSMLIDPNLDSPANVDAAKMFREKRDEYNKKIRQLAEKSVSFWSVIFSIYDCSTQFTNYLEYSLSKLPVESPTFSKRY